MNVGLLSPHFMLINNYLETNNFADAVTPNLNTAYANISSKIINLAFKITNCSILLYEKLF